jgi:hypothetical protein
VVREYDREEDDVHSKRSSFQAVIMPPEALMEGIKRNERQEGGRKKLALNEVKDCSFDS